MTSNEQATDIFGIATPWLEMLAGAIDLMAIIVLIIGAARFLVKLIGGEFKSSDDHRLSIMNAARRELGSYILAGLELLIVSDVIHTAITLELDGLYFLGGLVVIRAVISFFLEREIKQLAPVEPEDSSRQRSRGER